MYTVSILPPAKADLHGIACYIAHELHEPVIARKITGLLKEKIKGLKDFPFAYREYLPVKPLEDTYRIMPVKNYLVLYVVSDNVVEIRRVVHSRQNYESLL